MYIRLSKFGKPILFPWGLLLEIYFLSFISVSLKRNATPMIFQLFFPIDGKLFIVPDRIFIRTVSLQPFKESKPGGSPIFFFKFGKLFFFLRFIFERDATYPGEEKWKKNNNDRLSPILMTFLFFFFFCSFSKLTIQQIHSFKIYNSCL